MNLSQPVKWSLIGLGLILILLIIQFVPTQQVTYDANVYPKEGFVAPPFRFPDLNGKLIHLSDFSGRVVVINFFATWCQPCREEMPTLQKLHDTLPPDQFTLLIISVDNDKSALMRYLEKHQFKMNVLHDQNALAHTLYQITGYPETFIVNQKGVIVKKIIGPMDWSSQEMMAYFKGLIEQKQPHPG